MRYLKIGNAGAISEEAIELLGFSDKRGDSRTIGEKGTGLKFSRIQSVRKGLEFVVCTHEFKNVLRTKRGSSRLVFDYDYWGDKKKKIVDSSYTVDAGFSDWVDDWYIVREIVQNARDENFIALNLKNAMENTINSISIEKEITRPKPNETFVYLELTSDMERIFQKINKYFCDDSKFLLDTKHKENYMSVYLKGIYVGKYAAECYYSDICVSEIDLTESRDIKHSWQVMEQFYSSMSGQDIKEIRKFLRYLYNNKDACESKDFYGIQACIGRRFYDAFVEEFGTEVIIHPTNSVDTYKKEAIKNSDKTFISIGKVMYDFLKGRGIQTLEDLISNSGNNYELISEEFDISYEKDLCDKYFGKKDVWFFKTLDDSLLGFAKGTDVFINKSIVGSDLLLTTMVEEYIHSHTGHKDYSRSFQDFTCATIADLLRKK